MGNVIVSRFSQKHIVALCWGLAGKKDPSVPHSLDILGINVLRHRKTKLPAKISGRKFLLILLVIQEVALYVSKVNV